MDFSVIFLEFAKNCRIRGCEFWLKVASFVLLISRCGVQSSCFSARWLLGWLVLLQDLSGMASIRLLVFLILWRVEVGSGLGFGHGRNFCENSPWSMEFFEDSSYRRWICIYNIVIILPCYSINRSVTFFFHENNLDEVIFGGLFDPVLAGVVALCRSPYKQREPARPWDGSAFPVASSHPLEVKGSMTFIIFFRFFLQADFHHL